MKGSFRAWHKYISLKYEIKINHILQTLTMFKLDLTIPMWTTSECFLYKFIPLPFIYSISRTIPVANVILPTNQNAEALKIFTCMHLHFIMYVIQDG